MSNLICERLYHYFFLQEPHVPSLISCSLKLPLISWFSECLKSISGKLGTVWADIAFNMFFIDILVLTLIGVAGGYAMHSTFLRGETPVKCATHKQEDANASCPDCQKAAPKQSEDAKKK